MDTLATAKALAEARAVVAGLEAYDGSVAAHQALLSRASAVRAAMEAPYDTATRWLENMSAGAAMNLVVRTGAFEKFPALGTGGSISAADLASACGVDTSVMTRAVRVLVANGLFAETGADTYAHNAGSAAFAPGAGLGGFVGVCVDIMQAWAGLPRYCTDAVACAAGMEGRTYYEVLETDPARRALWDGTLQAMASNFPVLGMFPFRERLRAQDGGGGGRHRADIVDVGGGRGQALLAIQGDGEGVFSGRLVLQDLPTVIDTLKPEDIPGIEPMAYDIFTPQPVQGARVYLMRRLLHDFYDPEAVQILRNTAAAMAPDSRLVICDMLVPDRVQVHGPMTLYWLDFSLLTIGGKERSRSEFEDVCAQAGLEIVDIYPSAGDNTVMLETRLKSR
ncbi:O-methyltransferase, putative [Cordyceps militaris CM01]|uniref:O-methyltransferase, putative n=1 Tax=Cordyceps militaris (strain CM01) TaxID=983644 RepID=G3JRB9_CORMM|nr:O-methyltransferase, putative [Cordyceps militaris CM01]EGX88469.1 O-methyltransferase, putative [Cordyceps militaris CM01]